MKYLWIKSNIDIWYKILTDDKPAEAKVECLKTLVRLVKEEMEG